MLDKESPSLIIVLSKTIYTESESYEVVNRLPAEELNIIMWQQLINLHEIAYGFSRIGKTLPEEIRFLKILDFTSKNALLSAKLESELEKAGNAVGKFDTMIACLYKQKCSNGNV